MSTHKTLTRISKGDPDPLTFFVNALGRSLSWAPAEAGGTPQDLPAAVAVAIMADRSLAPHFRIDDVVQDAGQKGTPADAGKPSPRAREAAKEPAK